MNLVVDHSYKLSHTRHHTKTQDAVYYFDIVKVSTVLNLDIRATNAYEAFVLLMLVHPTPRSIFEYIPPLLDDEPILGRYIRPSLSIKAIQLLKDTASVDCTIQNTNYSLHCNSEDLDLYCCATRLAQILGYQSDFIEHKLDPNKVGVTSELTTRMLNATWTEHIHIHENDCPYPGKIAFIEDVRGGVFLHDTKRPPGLIIFRWLDHVAYAVGHEFVRLDKRETVLERFNDRLRKLGMSQIKKTFLEKYPLNSGRAGGKIFLTTDNALDVAFDSIETRIMAELLLSANNDWENVAATALLLVPGVQLSGNNILQVLLENTWILDLCFTDYVKVCKHIHKLTRINGTLPKHWFRFGDKERERQWTNSVYGIDIIGGRSEKLEFDTKGEMLMRLADPVKRAKLAITTHGLSFDYDSYDEYLDKMVATAAEELIVPQVRAETLENWYSRRFFWGPSGGAPGAEVEWDYGPGLKTDRFRLNKRGALAAIPFKHVKEVFENANEIAVQWSVEALKFESAKMRGILNTGMFPFIAQAYILTHFDSNVDTTSWFATAHGNTTRVANSLRRLSDLRNHVALMWDYADFNINHTLKMMLYMYTHIVRVLLLRVKYTIPDHVLTQLKSDFSNTLRFVLHARNNTYLRDNEHDITVRAMRSLQSGERGTSTTNSFFNRVDSNIVRETGKRLVGRDLLPFPSDKLGDDDFETTKTMRDAMIACALFNLTGAAGQIYKILVEYPGKHGSHGEFLRLSYDSANNVISGYPLRAMMGFIHGEFFNDPMPQPFERVATVLEQAAKLSRRGYYVSTRLLTAWVRNNACLVYTDKSGKKHRVTGDFRLAMTPGAFGGIGVTYTKDSTLLASNIKLGIRDPVRPVIREPLAICIPSGEGKSTLARTYDIFIDHDTLVDTAVLDALRESALLTSNWNRVNDYLRGVASECQDFMKGKKILLTWSKHTTPSIARTFGIQLARGTGIRANKAGRATLQRDFGSKLVIAPNFGLLTSTVLDIYLNSLTRHTYEFDMFVSSVPKPAYKPPNVDVAGLLHRSGLHVKDFDTLRRHQVPTKRSVYEEIGHSSLTGGYPKAALNESLAIYARSIDAWYSHGHWETKRTHITPIFSTVKVKQIAQDVVTSSLGIKLARRQHTTEQAFTLNEMHHPDVHEIKHHYGGFTRLLKPLGASTQVTIQAIVDNTQPLIYTGKLGRLYALIKAEATRQSQNVLLTKDLKDRDILTELSLFIDSIGLQNSKLDTLTDGRNPIIANALSATVLDSTLYEYIKGDMELIPPINPGVSAELISLVRGAALASIEAEPKILRKLLLEQTAKALIAFRAYEHELLIAIIKLLNINYPGVSLRD
nr:MAG: putative RNA-dependent RNA polymerase [Trichoderma harzianum dsRNA virus 2]